MFESLLTMNPLTGVPLLLLVLYFGLYQFVGGFGAGTIVAVRIPCVEDHRDCTDPAPQSV